MPLSTFLGLIFWNLIWSAHPLMSKWMLEDFTPIQVVGFRYLSAFLTFILLKLVLKGKSKRKESSLFILPQSRRDFAFLVVMGVLTYCYSPLFQITGLSHSGASENSLIVAIEPLATVFLAWLFFHEQVHAFEVGGFILALLGFGFLSGLRWGGFSLGGPSHFYGNLLMLGSLLGESSFSVLGSQLVRRYSSSAVFGTTLGIGLLALFLCMSVLEKNFFQASWFISLFHQFSWKSVLALLWLGPVGTAGGYLYALVALSRASVVSVTLMLFIQPLAGVYLGILFFGEKLTGFQILGSTLILIALLLSVWSRLRWSKKKAVER